MRASCWMKSVRRSQTRTRGLSRVGSTRKQQCHELWDLEGTPGAAGGPNERRGHREKGEKKMEDPKFKIHAVRRRRGSLGVDEVLA